MKKNNCFFDKMMKTIVVCSVIQIICIIIIAMFDYTLSKKYEDMINTNIDVSEDINSIMSSLYKAQDIINEYTDTGNSSENLSDAINSLGKIEVSADRLVRNVKNLKDDNLTKTAENIGSRSIILCGSMKNMLSKVSKGEIITKDETQCLIDSPIQTLQGYTGSILVQISLSNEKENKNYRKIARASTIIEGIMVIAIITSTLYCMYVIKKNGKQMLVSQNLAEKVADQSISKAYKDNLTGLWNRKYIEIMVEKAISAGEQGCLFMFDMDNFKSVNDTYGHIAGDDVLKAFAKVLMTTSRDYDICCRAGGDEFMLFARKTPVSQARVIADRIFQSMEKEFSPLNGGKIVTVSIGITPISENISSFKEMYEKADRALYHIKKNGKNAYKVEV